MRFRRNVGNPSPGFRDQDGRLMPLFWTITGALRAKPSLGSIDTEGGIAKWQCISSAS
jgi:hypothetical protein